MKAVPAAALLALLTFGPAAAEEPIRIGFISTFSGPSGVLGQELLDGFRLGVESLGGKLGGRPAMIIDGDDQTKPDVGRQLADDPKIRADMNEGFVVALSSFVESQKSGVSIFIAEQVKRWDLAQLTRLIEINIGRDLQYIRFNGMLIGGLTGLALHAAELLLFAN